MSAQKAKDLLIKIQSGASYVTVAGLRSKQLRLNTETIDITHSESAGLWRELLEGAGVKRCSLTGSGIFKDEASDMLIKNLFFNGQLAAFQVVIPDFGTLEGVFQVTSVEYHGQHQGELAAELAFESAGALTFTAL